MKFFDRREIRERHGCGTAGGQLSLDRTFPSSSNAPHELDQPRFVRM